MEMILFYEFMTIVLIVGGVFGAIYMIGGRNNNKPKK